MSLILCSLLALVVITGVLSVRESFLLDREIDLLRESIDRMEQRLRR